MAESVTSRDDRIDEDVRRRIHPPSKKLCDQQIEAVVQKISALEVKLKSMKAQSSDNVSASSTHEREAQVLKTLREDKENKMKKRKEIEEKHKLIVGTISRKNDELSKRQARLPTKSVDKLESMIKRLQYQLEKNHFTLREETRIVHEIDSLKRSMKTLRECIAEKEELDVEIAKKNRLRAERDKVFKEISGLLEEEHKVKRQLRELRSQANIEYTSLKKEIDELYNQKRKISANYQAEMRQFYERRAHHRAQSERHQQQQTMQREARHRELIKQKVKEPFADKLKVCSTLLTYLLRCSNDTPDTSTHSVLLGGQERGLSIMQSSQDNASASHNPHLPAGSSLSPSSSFNEDVGRVIHRKKNDEDEWMFAGNVSRIKKKQAKMRSRKASWMSKSISHPPDIFPLFSELGLTAPSSVGDIAEVVSQLQKAKDQYEQCSRKQRSDTGNTGIDSGTASSSECYSPSTADMVPDFKGHGNKQNLGLTDSTHQASEDDDEIDSVFDDTTENIECAADDDNDFQGVYITQRASDDKPHLKLKIGTQNHTYFETSQPLAKQNILETGDALSSQEEASPNDDRFVSKSYGTPSLPEDQLGTRMNSLNVSDICEGGRGSNDEQSLVVPQTQQELLAKADASV